MWWYNILDNYCNFSVSPSRSNWALLGSSRAPIFPQKSNCLFFVKWIFAFVFSSLSKLAKVSFRLHDALVLRRNDWKNGNQKGGNFHITFQQIYSQFVWVSLVCFCGWFGVDLVRRALHLNWKTSTSTYFAKTLFSFNRTETNELERWLSGLNKEVFYAGASPENIIKRAQKSRFPSGGRHASTSFFSISFVLTNFILFRFWLFFFSVC